MRGNLQQHLVVTANPKHVFTQAGENSVILDLEVGTYYGLNQTGTWIWESLQEGPRTVGQITEALCREYDVESDRVVHDLSSLLREMAAQGLVAINNEETT